MFWRFLQHAWKWIWRAILAVVIPMLGLAFAAAQVWDDARTWVEHHVATAMAMAANPVSWIVAFLAVSVWFGAFVNIDRKREPKRENLQRLSDRLRAIKGVDPVPHLAHVEFMGNAQRAKARRLNDAIILAGWETNLGNMAQSHLQKNIEGIEVSGFNMSVVDEVSIALDKAGFGPVSKVLKQLGFDSSNPKWERAQRTVYLMIGFPPS